MQTKLSAFAARVSESGWLAALIIVPLLFNIYTERVFEEDKIPLMRSIALLMGVMLLIWGFERGREALQMEGRPWWKVPLVLPTLLLVGAYLLATVFSIVPRISFWGAYIRRQGTYTWLSYIIIFFGVLFLARDRRQVTRIITVILLASIPATLYAFLQNRGLDPLPWGGDVTRRVSSTAGNPIFISAYLIMVVPLTLMRVLEHFKQLLRTPTEDDSANPPNYLASSLLAGAYLFLLIVQLVTIVYSQSRGPLLGLLVGLTFFAILASLPISRWLTLAFTGMAVLGIAFLIVFNLPNSPLEPLREVKYLGRLGRVFEVSEGNGLVRVLIWKGATELLAANPVRDVVGYGPEAMYVAYNPYYPPELAQVEQRNASPDRSHNETFDSLVMTGILGFVAQLSVFLTLFYYVLKWLGLIHSARQRTLFWGLMLLMGVGGLLLPYFLTGSFELSGVGLPAGLALGLIAYLLVYIVTHVRDVGKQQHPNALLLVALLAAVLSHFIEVHFGIAIGATRLYFWVYAALLVVVGLPLLSYEGAEGGVEGESEAGTARRKRRATNARRLAQGQGSLLSGTLLGLSLMMSLILIVMTFNFYTPTIDLSAKGFSMVWLFLGTILFGALVVTAEAAFEQEGSGWLPRLGLYAAISLGIWLLFCVIYLPWIQARQVAGSITMEELIGLGGRLANSITLVYLFTFLLIALSAWAFLREESSARFGMRAPLWLASGYGLLLVAIVPMIVMTNLNVSRADVYSKQGSGYERGGQWDAAILFYQTALSMQRHEDRYFLNMGRAFMEKARTITDNPDLRNQYLQDAQNVLENAQSTNPMNTDHTRNLASLHRVWSSMAGDATEQQRHLQLADDYYAKAVALSPNNAAIWNDWASLAAERGETELALERLGQSLSVDALWANTYMLRANIHIQGENYEAALADYDKILTMNGADLAAMSGRAFTLAKLERTDEAIEANKQVLAVEPNDYNTYKNLALLYQQTGQIDLAMAAAQNALPLATPQERPAMESFIQQLTLEQGAVSPPEG